MPTGEKGDKHRSATLNIIQTIAIVGSLALTLVLAAWNHSTQLREQDAESNQRSAELTLNLSEALDSGQAKVISMALDMDGNLDKTKVSDEERQCPLRCWN
jgi:hypothetical protein